MSCKQNCLLYPNNMPWGRCHTRARWVVGSLVFVLWPLLEQRVPDCVRRRRSSSRTGFSSARTRSRSCSHSCPCASCSPAGPSCSASSPGYWGESLPTQPGHAECSNASLTQHCLSFISRLHYTLSKNTLKSLPIQDPYILHILQAIHIQPVSRLQLRLLNVHSFYR